MSVGQSGHRTKSPASKTLRARTCTLGSILCVLGLIGALLAPPSPSQAATTHGTVWAWGYGGDGLLGNGSSVLTSPVPVMVTGLSDVIDVASGGQAGYAVKSDGTLWAWGHNVSGALGNGTTTDSYVPVQVSGLTQVTAVAGSTEGYALKSDGTVWGWGPGVYGALGTASAGSTTPVQIAGLSGVTAIDGGIYAGYALKFDGTVWAWGLNGHGALGDGTTTNSPTPVQVRGLVSRVVNDFTVCD